MQCKKRTKAASDHHIGQQVAKGEQAHRHRLHDAVGLHAANVADRPIGFWAVGVVVVAGNTGLFHHHRSDHRHCMCQQPGFFASIEQVVIVRPLAKPAQRVILRPGQLGRLAATKGIVRGKSVLHVQPMGADLIAQLDRHGRGDRDGPVAVVIVMGGKGGPVRIQAANHIAGHNSCARCPRPRPEPAPGGAAIDR